MTIALYILTLAALVWAYGAVAAAVEWFRRKNSGSSVWRESALYRRTTPEPSEN